VSDSSNVSLFGSDDDDVIVAPVPSSNAGLNAYTAIDTLVAVKAPGPTLAKGTGDDGIAGRPYEY
jgi:hypothetical protein